MLAPLIRGQKGEYRDLFDDLLKQGFVRARVDGTVVQLTDDLQLDRQMRHNIEVVIDRLVAGESRARLAEAVELALKMGEGSLIVAPSDDAEAPAEAKRPPRRRATAKKPASAERRTRRAARRRRRRFAALGPLRLHALRPELRAAEPAAVQLQQPAGHVHRRATGWASCTASIPSCWCPIAELSFKQGCFELIGPWHDLGRWRRHIYQGVADTIEHKHELEAGTMLETPWDELDRRAASSSGCTAPATSTSRSPGAAAARATSTAASSRASSRSCCRQVSQPQKQDAAAAARKVHAA